MLALQGQVTDLVDENKLLRDKLANQEDLEFRKNSYWRKSTTEGPFCSRCWDSEAMLVRLHSRQSYQPSCPKCNVIAADPDQPFYMGNLSG